MPLLLPCYCSSDSLAEIQWTSTCGKNLNIRRLLCSTEVCCIFSIGSYRPSKSYSNLQPPFTKLQMYYLLTGSNPLFFTVFSITSSNSHTWTCGGSSLILFINQPICKFSLHSSPLQLIGIRMNMKIMGQRSLYSNSVGVQELSLCKLSPQAV